jgi:hypothetical protein
MIQINFRSRSSFTYVFEDISRTFRNPQIIRFRYWCAPNPFSILVTLLSTVGRKNSAQQSPRGPSLAIRKARPVQAQTHLTRPSPDSPTAPPSSPSPAASPAHRCPAPPPSVPSPPERPRLTSADRLPRLLTADS